MLDEKPQFEIRETANGIEELWVNHKFIMHVEDSKDFAPWAGKETLQEAVSRIALFLGYDYTYKKWNGEK